MQDAQYAAKLHHVERGLRSAARGLIRIQKTYGKDEDTVKNLSDLGDAIRDALRTHHALTSPTEKKRVLLLSGRVDVGIDIVRGRCEEMWKGAKRSRRRAR